MEQDAAGMRGVVRVDERAEEEEERVVGFFDVGLAEDEDAEPDCAF